MQTNNDDKTIYFNFSYFAMKLLGKGMYSNAWTALAELVANGFDAQASNVYILLDMRTKKNTTIEIFDDGVGMNYNDLAEKYVLIGKNKRIDEVNEELKNSVMGRKGVGKLAALYLSDKFYIFSKTKIEESAWCLDLKTAKDSDIPKLSRTDELETDLLCEKEWKDSNTGTIIKLTDVDLTNVGEKTLDGFKARLADFYLINEINKSIYICILNDDNNEKKFTKVTKEIAFKNMFAFFYTEGFENYLNELSESVYFHSNIASIDEKKRSTQIFKPEEFLTKGEKVFVNDLGVSKTYQYELRGWIGLHTSINNNHAHKNDVRFLKNGTYNPNKLRLYIRKKLAVENFMDNLRNTQAFGNYIEGEISFDILDENSLPDITTSNRQDISQDDERLEILKNFVKPIINSLINSRIKLGNAVNQEEANFRDEETRKLEEQKEKAEKEKEIAEAKKNKAEDEKRRAEEQRQKAESERKKAVEAEKKAKKESDSEQRRNFFYLGLISEEMKDFAKRFHLVKTNNQTIKNTINDILYYNSNGKLTNEILEKDLKAISFSSEKISSVLTYGTIANFEFENENITDNLFSFIEDYCNNILKARVSLKISVMNDTCYIRKFSPQNISVVIENVYSNSAKHNASKLIVKLYEDKSAYHIDFIDDGKGLNESAKENSSLLFEFGKSYTAGGTGVGLYHVRDIVENKMKGEVSVNLERKNGFCLQIDFKK